MQIKNTSDLGLPRRRRASYWMLAIFVGAASSGFHIDQALAEDVVAESRDLTELSIEDLMDLEVTSVAKREQRVSDAAAAVFVITAEDIRTSGATAVPELLRMVPGLQVAQIDTNHWAITSRGFNGIFANKLLVMIDGRSVYTPIFSGVYWDIQDVPLGTIERIEVIRGPGASLWGANAENGVINIITKNADKTQGMTVVAGAGTEERGVGSVTYGGRLSSSTSYRVYSKAFDRDNSETPTGGSAQDSWRGMLSGFRVDSALSQSTLTVSGDAYGGNEGFAGATPVPYPPFEEDVSTRGNYGGGNLEGRWRTNLDSGGALEILGYYTRDYRSGLIDSTLDTANLEMQHEIKIAKSHDLIWGLGYRLVADDLDGMRSVQFPNSSETNELFSSFIQDEIRLRDDLTFLAGTKLEHNDYTDWELQPTARLAWRPCKQSTIWTAVSRAVRTPSRAEHSVILTLDTGIDPKTGLPYVVSLLGSQQTASENLQAYELGLRREVGENLSFDLVGFFHQYTDTFSTKSETPRLASSPTPYIDSTQIIGNGADLNSYGGEALVDWRPRRDYHLQLWYTYIDFGTPDFDTETDNVLTEGNSVHSLAGARAIVELTPGLELSSFLRYVDGVDSIKIPDYADLNLGLIWRARSDLELSVWGMNLLQDSHPEFNSSFVSLNSAEIERSLFFRLIWHYNNSTN